LLEPIPRLKVIETRALLLRSVAYGESDLILTLFTEAEGKLGVMARGGRRSKTRAAGALEPFHTMAVRLEDRGGSSPLVSLRAADLVQVRHRLVSDLDALEKAGKALQWARHLFPTRTPEPLGWQGLQDCLDALNEGREPMLELAAVGLTLLEQSGYGLDLDACVVCGRVCPDGKAAAVHPGKGGLLCQGCGGAPRMLSAAERSAAQGLVRGERPALGPLGAASLVALVEEAMALHADYER
jgi:DNA repair protein RecO (recombination protein O)